MNELFDFIKDYGGYAGAASVLGLAVLSLLYFAQAREVKRLREWAGRAPERSAELEQRVVADASRRQVTPMPVRTPPPPRPGQPQTPAAQASGANGQTTGAPAATPAGATAATAAPAATGAAAATPAAAAGATATAGAATPGAPDAAEKPAEAEPEDVKPGDAKPADVKPGDGDAAKPAATATDAKPAGAKPAEAKPADGDDAEAGEANPPMPGAAAPVAAAATPPPAPAAPAAPSAATPPPAPAVPASTPPVPPAPRTPAGRPRPAGPAQPLRAGAASATVPPRRRVPGTAHGSRRTLVIAGGAAAVLLVGIILITTLGGGDEPGERPEASSNPIVSPQPEPAGDEPSTSATPRSEIQVGVFNATTVNGLARTVAQKVEGGGYSLGTVDNAPPPERSSTLVAYAEDRRAAARQVARVIGVGADVVQPMDTNTRVLDEDADVVVIVGADQNQSPQG